MSLSRLVPPQWIRRPAVAAAITMIVYLVIGGPQTAQSVAQVVRVASGDTGKRGWLPPLKPNLDIHERRQFNRPRTDHRPRLPLPLIFEAVVMERLCTVFRDTGRSPTISFSVLPCQKNSRRISAIVSRTSSPATRPKPRTGSRTKPNVGSILDADTTPSSRGQNCPLNYRGDRQ